MFWGARRECFKVGKARMCLQEAGESARTMMQRCRKKILRPLSYKDDEVEMKCHPESLLFSSASEPQDSGFPREKK